MFNEFGVPSGDCGSLCAGSTFAGRDASLSMKTEEEIWKPVPEFTTVMVSNLGNICRKHTHFDCWYTYQGFKTNDGYRAVKVGNRRERCHRLIAKAFIPNPHGLPHVNHLNGVKHDNRVSNLEWCDDSMNQYHAIRTGLKIPVFGEGHGLSRLTDSSARAIYIAVNIGGKSHSEVAGYWGVAKSVAASCANLVTWKVVNENYSALTMKIFIEFDFDSEQFILMASDDKMSAMPCGARLFKGPPHPGIKFKHSSAEEAEADAQKLRAYLAQLVVTKKPSKKEKAAQVA